jgi:hypothetical protein
LAPLPTTTTISPTVLAIYRAYELAARDWDSWGISVGDIGLECDRALWLAMRWVGEREFIGGRKRSIFETGNLWEERIVANLEAAGCSVWGQQDKMRFAHGHLRGKRDGAVSGLVEAPVTEHLLEVKSHKEDKFNEVKKKGVRVAQPTHYGQCQLGCHAFGHSRWAYVIVNKNTDERHIERGEYDADYCLRQIARAERIALSPEPPGRLCKDETDFRGMFCRQKDVCWGKAMPRVHCRSCLHGSAEPHGDAAWSCGRWMKPLSIDEQREGCPNHLHIPALVPAEQIDVDEANETITYRMPSGELWIDGASA